jgi:hypothetical protein
MIPWFPGGHADPWNHTEAAMALALGGRRREASGPTSGSSTGSGPTAPGTSTTWPTSIEESKLDANVCAYVAAGRGTTSS